MNGNKLISIHNIKKEHIEEINPQELSNYDVPNESHREQFEFYSSNNNRLIRPEDIKEEPIDTNKSELIDITPQTELKTNTNILDLNQNDGVSLLNNKNSLESKEENSVFKQPLFIVSDNVIPSNYSPTMEWQRQDDLDVHTNKSIHFKDAALNSFAISAAVNMEQWKQENLNFRKRMSAHFKEDALPTTSITVDQITSPILGTMKQWRRNNLKFRKKMVANFKEDDPYTISSMEQWKKENLNFRKVMSANFKEVALASSPSVVDTAPSNNIKECISNISVLKKKKNNKKWQKNKALHSQIRWVKVEESTPKSIIRISKTIPDCAEVDVVTESQRVSNILKISRCDKGYFMKPTKNQDT